MPFRVDSEVGLPRQYVMRDMVRVEGVVVPLAVRAKKDGQPMAKQDGQPLWPTTSGQPR